MEYKDIVEYTSTQEYMSVSKITRVFEVGYTKSLEAFKKLIEDGYIVKTGTAKGNKVLLNREDNDKLLEVTFLGSEEEWKEFCKEKNIVTNAKVTFKSR